MPDRIEFTNPKPIYTNIVVTYDDDSRHITEVVSEHGHRDVYEWHPSGMMKNVTLHNKDGSLGVYAEFDETGMLTHHLRNGKMMVKTIEGVPMWLMKDNDFLPYIRLGYLDETVGYQPYAEMEPRKARVESETRYLDYTPDERWGYVMDHPMTAKRDLD